MDKQLWIWNHNSGRSESHHPLATQRATENSQWVSMTRETKLPEEVQKAVDNGVQTVVAAGGDGTVNAVVNALMTVEASSRPKLAILPLGTANDFAGTLCIPDAIPQAIELLDTSQCLPIDVVRIRADRFERYYANIAAGGNSVRVSEEMTEEIKERWGAFCYMRGAVGVLAELESFRITAECDGERFEDFNSWAVLVANGKTNAGRLVVAPHASPIDGLLDVVLIRDGTVLDMVEIVSGALLGNYLECEQVIFRQVRQLKLHSVPGMRFTLDGELIDQEPVQFDVVPGAIRMYVGSKFLLENQSQIAEPQGPIHRALGTQNA